MQKNKTFANISLLNHKISIIFKKTIFDIEGMTLITHSYAPFLLQGARKILSDPFFLQRFAQFSL